MLFRSEEVTLEIGFDQGLGVHRWMREKGLPGEGTAYSRSLEAGRAWWSNEPGSQGVWTWREVTDNGCW